MRYSPERRTLLGIGITAAFLSACRTTPQQSPGSRAELQTRGVLPYEATRTPDPALGSRRVTSTATPSEQEQLSIKWDIERTNPSGVIVSVRYPTSSEEGIINVETPLQALRQQRALTDRIALNHQMLFSYNLVDLNGSQLYIAFALAREIPPLQTERTASLENWTQIKQSRMILATSYNESGFVGQPLTGFGS